MRYNDEVRIYLCLCNIENDLKMMENDLSRTKVASRQHQLQCKRKRVPKADDKTLTIKINLIIENKKKKKKSKKSKTSSEQVVAPPVQTQEGAESS